MTTESIDHPVPVTDPKVSRGPAHRGAGSLSAPQEAITLDIKGDLQDDVVYRRFVARQLATQTLSQQRAEWYTRSIRIHVMAAFWIGAISAAITIILLIVMVSAGSSDDSTSLYLP
jgi:hypothetical protein